MPGADFLIGVELQCGHGTEAVENRIPADIPSSPHGCFNAATALRPWRTKSARMQLRESAGFNAATALRPWRTVHPPPTAPSPAGLQCGHGTEAVENYSPCTNGLPMSELQCG